MKKLLKIVSIGWLDGEDLAEALNEGQIAVRRGGCDVG
jgi:hypothetical protein